jgi:hypothetical protein
MARNDGRREYAAPDLLPGITGHRNLLHGLNVGCSAAINGIVNGAECNNDIDGCMDARCCVITAMNFRETKHEDQLDGCVNYLS